MHEACDSPHRQKNLVMALLKKYSYTVMALLKKKTTNKNLTKNPKPNTALSVHKVPQNTTCLPFYT